MNEVKDKQVSAASWICTDEFNERLRVYFYVVALVVACQLIWMIDHSVNVMHNGSMDTVNQISLMDMGFTVEQIDKMDITETISYSNWSAEEPLDS